MHRNLIGGLHVLSGAQIGRTLESVFIVNSVGSPAFQVPSQSMICWGRWGLLNVALGSQHSERTKGDGLIRWDLGAAEHGDEELYWA